MLMAVDLPEPEGPVMATNSPARMSRSTPSRARTRASPSPYTFTTERRHNSAGGSAGDAIGFPAFGGELVDDLGADGQCRQGNAGQLTVGHAGLERHVPEGAARQ